MAVSASAGSCDLNEYDSSVGHWKCDPAQGTTSNVNCQGQRTCGEDGTCHGDSKCIAPYGHPTAEQCAISEPSGSTCTPGDECTGLRVCDAFGYCFGDSYCPEAPSKESCEIEQPYACRGPCKGNSYCSENKCVGDDECYLLENPCDIDEEKSYYGPGRCMKDYSCRGARLCDASGYCLGDDNCSASLLQ